jgi:hypothetical protein
MIVLNPAYGTMLLISTDPPIARDTFDALDLAMVVESLAAPVAFTQEEPRGVAAMPARTDVLSLRRINLGLPRLLKR